MEKATEDEEEDDKKARGWRRRRTRTRNGGGRRGRYRAPALESVLRSVASAPRQQLPARTAAQ